ncbi:hypothetical protein PUN28_013269 [Cardiocondyla obscurior]|uniref:Uncharacterized protein n=1 Tax=Cardiocondyla obscurior TaxID=286306 RepID=A0AAW2FCK5_9HYME
MAHSSASAIPSASKNERRRYEISSLLYLDAAYNIRDFISQEDNEKIGTSTLTLKILCGKNCNKMNKIQGSKCKCKNYSEESTGDTSHENIAVNASSNLETILNEGRELHIRNNSQSFCTSSEVFDSTGWYRRDNVLVNIDDVRYPILNTEQTCVDARKHIANYCCSIFNSEHQEYHICARGDYHVDSSDFNAEMQTDWTTGYAIWRRVPSRASLSVESGGNVADRRRSRLADTPGLEIDARPGRHRWQTTPAAERVGDRSYKSDFLKSADTRDVHAWTGRRCSNCVVAEPSHSDRNPGEKGESGRGVDSEWKRGSIETDAQQLDYKWERRIATVDVGTRARLDFKGKRDSR